LFSYVWAKANDGLCILRCEDTDPIRSNDDCLKCMIRDFDWVGIKFDAGFKVENGQTTEYDNTNLGIGPLRKSQRTKIYDRYIEKLLSQNKAYEKDGAIYFRMPKEDTSFVDGIAGKLTLPAKNCEDFPIRKKTGMAAFYFAMTVDDEEMGISDVIRGCEHINTCYRQVALQKALGFGMLNYYHIPLIMNQDGKKLSKRQTIGQVNVHDFKRDG